MPMGKTEDGKCELCKIKQGKYNGCNGDGGLHHHGAVHAHPKTYGGDSTNHLMWLCKGCNEIDKKNWDDARAETEVGRLITKELE